VAWLLLVVLLAWVVRTTEVTDPIAKHPYYILPGRADWFAIGMLLAVLTAAHVRGLAPKILLAPGRHPGLTWIAALALTTASALIPVHFEELRDQLDTFAAAALIAGAVLVGPVLRGPQRWLAARPAQAIGRWSYGIFLWGYIVQKALEKLIPGISTAPHLLLTLVLAVALGAASWKFIEEPVSRRLGRRRPKDSNAPSKLPRLEAPAAGAPSQAAAR
jgi:peptidoglycan/LPS O-acetylase OafA/YrhL